MDPEVAQHRLQEVQLHAYASLLRCLRDRSLNISMLQRETLQTKVRLEFGIAPTQHKELLAQVAQEESQPSSAAPSHGYAPPAPKPAPLRKQPSKAAAAKGKAHAVMDLNAHLPTAPVHTVAPTYVPPPIDGPADRKKRIQEINYRKVQRWWPNEGGWWIAVISKYNPDNGSCELVYNLDKKGVPQSEAYNLHAATVDHCKMTEEYATPAEIKKLKSSS